MQSSIASWVVVFCACATSPDLTHASYGSTELGALPDAFLREVMFRVEPDLAAGSGVDPDEVDLSEPVLNRVAKEFGQDRQNFLGPSLRDQEYLQHSSLWGHQYMQGGAGEGRQRLKPDGSVKNLQSVKTDAVLPAYCNPPNPCPQGYSASSGCLEEFVNTAAFSREYQASQQCMCDNEHMFDCPGTSQDTEIDALARSIQNEGLVDSTIDRIVHNMQIDGEHKSLVAKKFFNKKPKSSHDELFRPKEKKSIRTSFHHRQEKIPKQRGSKDVNPFLVGEKLPVVAKKSPIMPHM